MSDTPDTGYQVLARKYRPQTFADLIGQDAMVRTLKERLRGRPHRAGIHADRHSRDWQAPRPRASIAKGLNCIGPDGTGGPTTDPPPPCGVLRELQRPSPRVAMST